jgi:hypothetical protein
MIGRAAAFAAFLLAAVSSVSHAQSWGLPGTIDTYRFLPRPSIINQQGGIAGFDIDYHIRGTFDFTIEQSPLAVYPPMHVATFPKVDAVGVNPRWPDLDVDQALNLTGIHGGERLYPRRPDLFLFRGKTDDGSAVELAVKLEGPWLYMRGRTTAPPESADFFEYQIKAIARRQPDADFNADGKVDGADLAAWSAGASPSGGDFLNWQRQLGEVAPSIESMDQSLDAALAASGVAFAAAVPEPAAVMLAMIGLAALTVRRRSV